MRAGVRGWGAVVVMVAVRVSAGADPSGDSVLRLPRRFEWVTLERAEERRQDCAYLEHHAGTFRTMR